MPAARFRFYGDLNFFLLRSRQNTTLTHPFDWRASVKDMIESLGVPHPEIDLLVINGVSVGFEAIVQDGDEIEVYPFFHERIISPKIPLRPPLAGQPAFILDQHLGRLAAYLRMTGFDTLYRNDYHDDELAQVSHDERRVLLTRDVGLLKRSLVIYGYYVRETNRHSQLAEVAHRYGLRRWAAPFKHCMKCNGLLHPAAKSDVLHSLQDGTARHYEEFHQCANCGRVYWKGPHYQRMQGLMERILGDS